jgi:hypothetical protein
VLDLVAGPEQRFPACHRVGADDGAVHMCVSLEPCRRAQ